MNYESTVSANDAAGYYEPEEQRVANARRRNIIIAAIIALLVVGIGAWYFTSQNKPAAGTENASDQAPAITVDVPGQQTVVRSIAATGTLGARHDVLVGAVGEGGRITRVYVQAGDWVKQGQTLATVDRGVQTQQIAALDAQIGVARADLKLAQNNLDRAQKLVAKGFISTADVDRLTATRDAAAARVRVAQAQLGESRARTNRLDILAPVGGYVLDRMVEPGQTVTQGSGTLFRIAQNGQMEMRAQMNEEDLAQLSVGIAAEITPVGTERIFTGNIWQISPVIDPQTRQGIARIALPYDRALRPGGFANVAIKSGASVAPVLPESAVLNDAKGNYVYIVGADNKVTRRDIKTGAVTAAGVTIAEGLTGQEQVVMRAGGFLNPGEKIRPVRAKKTG
ncbi:MAG: efflux RND transporter periplasmic adaptor subunit [Parasphingorhabdus sp.]|nr:efflux RND transporter periplasmic adaptor subunit [Parasphingorhabdus sp.]